MDLKLQNLTGTVEDIIFKNVSNGYIVLEMDCDEQLVCVVGNLGDISEGEKLSLTGKYITSPKYGQQFNALTCERTPPESVYEIQRYLASGIIKGLGPSLAKKITDHFGEKTLHLIENNPEKLVEIKGITPDRADFIGSEYKKICNVKNVISFLSEYGLPPKIAVLVWQKHENSSISAIKENPYILCRDGIDIDFEIADKIAGDLKIDNFNTHRVNAAISHVLKENANYGHTCLPEEALGQQVRENYKIDSDSFEISLNDGIDKSDFGILTAGDKNRIYLSNYYQAERYIADKLIFMLKLNLSSQKDFTEEISQIEKFEGIKYETLQKEAINGCLGNNLFILTGGPGTGKTTTLNAVIKLLKHKNKSLCLAAPTGRAAKRMADLTGENAKTIHRLLEVDMSADNLLTFKRNELNPLKTDAVIIDEVSMVDVLLFESLLRAVKPESKLILVGDFNQLPSVGAGNVLKDLIVSEIIPTLELKEIFRQAAESLIVTNAHKIVRGEMPELEIRDKDFFFMDKQTDEGIAELIIELVKKRLPKSYNYDPIDDIQILSPTKMGPAGTRELNKSLQLALNPSSKNRREIKVFDVVFREGDKVMQIANDYDVEWKRNGKQGKGVFNGDIGIISEIRPQNGNISINFDGRVATYSPTMLNKIEHAYAITIHKSQGSEYNAVIIPLTTRSKQLLYRNLLYTGVTRAKNILILIGSRNTVRLMIESNKKTIRYSNIKPLLIAKYRKEIEDENKQI